METTVRWGSVAHRACTAWLSASGRVECILVWAASIRQRGRQLLCQCAGDNAAKEVPDNKATRPSIWLAQRDDTPKTKGWHNVIWHPGARNLGRQNNAENFRSHARRARGSSLACTAKVGKEGSAVQHEGFRWVPRGNGRVTWTVGFGGAPLGTWGAPSPEILQKE